MVLDAIINNPFLIGFSRDYWGKEVADSISTFISINWGVPVGFQ
jgi:hypothetical protein